MCVVELPVYLDIILDIVSAADFSSGNSVLLLLLYFWCISSRAATSTFLDSVDFIFSIGSISGFIAIPI